MNQSEYQHEIAKYDESIANAERQIVQNQLSLAQIKHNKARFILECSEAVVKKVKEQAAESLNKQKLVEQE